jgi:hypothetical protein
MYAITATMRTVNGAFAIVRCIGVATQMSTHARQTLTRCCLIKDRSSGAQTHQEKLQPCLRF